MNGYDIYLTNNMNQNWIYIVDKYDIYNFTNNNWSVGCVWTDAQDGYLLVNMIMTHGSYGILEYPVFLQTLTQFLVADELTNGAWQLLDAVSWFQAGACTAALEVLQLNSAERLHLLPDLPVKVSPVILCVYVCFLVHVLCRTTSSVPLSHVPLSHLFSWQLRALRFLASAFGQRRVLNMWVDASLVGRNVWIFAPFRSLVFVLESVKARNASMAILQLCGPNLCEKEKALLSSPSVVMASILRVCLTMLVLMGADGGPLAYGICQTGCNSLAVACYAAAGATFGTVTAGAGVPAAILACNAALGTCMAACVAAGFAPTPWTPSRANGSVQA